MADEIRPTPRNPLFGLFSDFVNVPLDYMSDPRRTQQMQGIASFIRGTGVPSTLENLSYNPSGRGLFTGAGGLGGTTRMRPEALEAALTLAPGVGPAARLTRGLPVGASIKNVGSKFNVASRDASDIFGAGSARVRYTEPNSGGSIEVLSKPDGSASVLSLEVPEKFRGQKIGESLQAQVMQDFPVLQGQVSSRAAAKTAYRLGRRPPGQPEASLDDVYKIMDEYSSVNLVSPTMQRQVFMPPQAPQQAALDLAQQRAALPVEQGGLGLRAGNTAEQRAKAMGFDVEAYHGTASKDIQKFMPEGGTPEGDKTLEWYKNRQAQNQPVGYMSFRSGSFFSPKAEYAGSYAPEGAGVMYPVNLRMENPLSLLPNAQGRYSATNAPDTNKTIDAMILQDSLDKSINEIAIINPDQIRSRFAAFDPFRRSAAVAATMGAAAPDLLASPMYTDPFGNTIADTTR